MSVKRTYKRLAAAVLVLMIIAAQPLAALATSGTTTTAATTTTTMPTFVISTSPSSSLGSISFKTSNSKRVEVGKSTYLYISIKDMAGSVSTSFSCSNTAIASIEKVNNTCVKVYGLKTGEVVITATAGGKSAKYSLIVGDEAVTTTTQGGGAAVVATTTTLPIDIGGLYSSDESALQQYIIEKKQKDVPGIILGLIGWAAIIGLGGTILSVVFNNRTPKLNVSPGTKHRFTSGGLSRKRKRLLPDHYYRSIRKY